MLQNNVSNKIPAHERKKSGVKPNLKIKIPEYNQ